jgi:NAD(P)-dependent dehydrogenase (short-subunit alcohol dehydrogenase family)
MPGTLRFLITGVAGFIGSAVARHLIENTEHRVFGLDKLTYAGNLDNLLPVISDTRLQFEKADICAPDVVRRILNDCRPDIIMHLAAESHVDRSIDGPAEFIQTNIIGTYVLLEAARRYWETLGQARQRFVFTTCRPTRCLVRLRQKAFFWRRRRTGRGRPIPPQKPALTIWLELGITPTVCQRYAPTAQIITDHFTFPKSSSR